MLHQALLPPLVLLLVDLLQLELELEFRKFGDYPLFVKLLLPHLTMNLLEDMLDALAGAQEGKGQDAKEASNDIAKRKLEEVTDNNVQTVVTQCPSCVHKFRKNSQRLVIKDLISYLNDCIEGVKE